MRRSLCWVLGSLVLVGWGCHSDEPDTKHRATPVSPSEDSASRMDAGAGVDASRAPPLLPASEEDAGSASDEMQEPPPPTQGDQPPLEPSAIGVFSCASDDIGWPGGISTLVTYRAVTRLAVDGSTLLGTRSGERGDEIWALDPAEGGQGRVVAPMANNVQVLVVDGGDLFFSTAPTGVVVVTKVPTTCGEPLNLAREAYSNVSSLIVNRRDVYWIADDANGTGGTTVVMHSERDPGQTQVLARLTGAGVPGTLVRVGNVLYFALWELNVAGAYLYRLSPDAEATPERLGDPAGIAALATDGEQLFAGLIGTRDRLDNPTGPRGVARVDPDDGSLELLFPNLDQSAGRLMFDASTVYWASDPLAADGQLWRGNKDGSGTPTKIAHGWQYSTDLVQTDSAVFWNIPCEENTFVLGVTKPTAMQ